MTPKYFVVVMALTGCGKVASTPGEPTADAPAESSSPITFKGTLAQTNPTMFGGAPYCTYNIVLKQLDVQLAIVPSSKQVTAGNVQNLNFETVVPTDPACPYPPASPTISNYTLFSASPSPTGMRLTFQGAAANTPVASLVADLSPIGSAYQVRLAFHRTDQPPPLDWAVVATVLLSAQ